MDINEHERLSNITLVKDQLVVRQDMDVNEHERLYNVTLVKEQLVVTKDTDVNENLYLHFCRNVMFDSPLSSFTSISVLNTSCFFTRICVLV
jgi:hypothetical protein